jgi:hypothetical protein
VLRRPDRPGGQSAEPVALADLSQEKKPIYRAGTFLMDQDIARKQAWTAAAINAREAQLVALALKVFTV